MKKLVNILTLIRIIATCFLPFVWHYFEPLQIIIFVALVLLTDSLDGFLARRFNVTTLFGALLDTIADKIFGIVLLIVVATVNPMFYLLVALEVFIAIINVLAAIKGATTKSTILGKTKMWIISIAIVFCLMYYFKDINYLKVNIPFIMDNIETIVDACLYIACGAELIVITDYLKHFIVELKNKHEKIKYNIKEKKDLLYVLFDTPYYIKHKNEPLSKHLLK